MGEEQLEMNYDNLFNFKGYNVMEAKFSIMTAFQTKCFEKEKYKQEEKFTIKNEKGEQEIKEVPLNRFIRWKYVNSNESNQETSNDKLDKIIGIRDKNANDGENKKMMKSNAKIVEWSDGSFQLMIGEEYYDIMFSTMDNVRYGVYDKSNDSIIINKPLKQRLILTPSEFSTTKKVEKAADTNETSQKTKLAYNFYDKQEYRKDDFSSLFGRKKQKAPKNDKVINKKRKRSNLS
jgi:hypothetical protein